MHTYILHVKPDGPVRDHHRPHGSPGRWHGLRGTPPDFGGLRRGLRLQNHPGVLATRCFCKTFRLLLDARLFHFLGRVGRTPRLRRRVAHSCVAGRAGGGSSMYV